MNDIRMTRLNNGLRIVTDRVTSVDSVAVGVWAGVGTRHEKLAENGVAHMVEHMLFKGTPDMDAARIAEAVEDVGGQMNAYTGRETTAYFMHLLKDDLDLALGIISDIIQHPTLPQQEIERERGVILQEIGMYADTPDDLVFDYFQETAYPGQALGAPILGTSGIISTIGRETLQNYIRRYYTPRRLVVAAAGNVDHDALVQKVESLFTDLPDDEESAFEPARYEGGESRTDKELEQSHIILGFEGVRRLDPLFDATRALSTALGGGMSSRLFQEIREKRGLVYAIGSFHSAYIDDGLFGIYAGTGPDLLAELVPVMCEEIRKIGATLTDEELARAKAQMRAGFLMGRESMMTRADQQAKYIALFDAPLSVEKRLADIEAITKDDVARAAEKLFSTTPTLTALGPLAQLEPLDTITQRLAAA